MNAQDPSERLIWATRGRSWGFRFLLDGGLTDPLPEYERMFADHDDEPTTWCRNGGKVACRFPDPLGRRDAAGRVIPHDLVVFGDLAKQIDSVEDCQHQVWPLIAEIYARVWDVADPPLAADHRPSC